MPDFLRPTRRSFVKGSAAALGVAGLTASPFASALGAEFPSRNMSVYIPTREGGGADRNFRAFAGVWKTFPDVIDAFQDWADIYYEEYLLCSWGDFDKRMFIQDCQLHDLDFKWAETHINLKRQYHEIKKRRKLRGLKYCLEAEGFEFEGTAHRAIDDAKNLVKIFDPFFTTKSVGSGTGLGLYISYGLATEQCRGNLTASNHVDGGAVFVLSLPKVNSNE